MNCLLRLLGLYEMLGLYILKLTQEEINQMIREWFEENGQP